MADAVAAAPVEATEPVAAVPAAEAPAPAPADAPSAAEAPAPAPAAAPTAAASLPPGMVGKWALDLKRSDSIEPFLEEMGVPWLIRKMAKGAMMRWVLSAVENGFIQETKSSFRNSTVTYIFNKETEVPNPGGSSMITALLPSPDTLQMRGTGPAGQSVVSNHVVIDDGKTLFMTMTVTRKAPGKDGKTELVVKRYFTRE